MTEKANNEKPLKRCRNAACAMRDAKVRTDMTQCITCHQDLVEAGSLTDVLGGGGGLDDLFGDLFKRPR